MFFIIVSFVSLLVGLEAERHFSLVDEKYSWFTRWFMIIVSIELESKQIMLLYHILGAFKNYMDQKGRGVLKSQCY